MEIIFSIPIELIKKEKIEKNEDKRILYIENKKDLLNSKKEKTQKKNDKQLGNNSFVTENKN